jgi:hypothetical protein
LYKHIGILEGQNVSARISLSRNSSAIGIRVGEMQGTYSNSLVVFMESYSDIPSNRELCKSERKELNRRYPETKGKNLFVPLAEILIIIEDKLKGYGLGWSGYILLFSAYFNEYGAFTVTPERCVMHGSTTEDAMRIWDKLKRFYPHKGDVVVIDEPIYIPPDITFMHRSQR